MIRDSRTNIVSRLGAVGVLLGTLSVSPSVMHMPAGLEISTTGRESAATTVEIDALAHSRLSSQALAEIGLVRAALAVPGLREESAFPTFIEAVDSALTAYEDSGRTPRDLVHLTVALRSARTILDRQIMSVVNWIALARSSDPALDRYVAVPQRFQSSERVSIAREQPPTAADIEALFEFDAGV